MQPADRPIYRTTLNLYLEDVRAMERIYGRGWTGIVRQLVEEHVKDKTPKPLTVGDLFGK